MLKKTSNLALELFSEMGDRSAIYLNDGSYFEGYILDIEMEGFTFRLGGPMAPDEPIFINYENLDWTKLYFFNGSWHGVEYIFEENIWILHTPKD